MVTEPTPGGDVDKDGVVDFIVCMAETREAGSDANRWVEAVSGKSGRTLWRRDLEGRWFTVLAGLNVPESFRWFVGSGAASSRMGGNGQLLSGEVLRRTPPRTERTGYFHHVPSRAMVLSWCPGHTQPPRLTLLAGSHVLAFDTTTENPSVLPWNAAWRRAASRWSSTWTVTGPTNSC